MKHTALLCRSVTIIIVAYVVGVCCRKEPEKQFAVFGYLPEYRLNNFDYEGVFSSGLTHLIFFSLEIDKQTSLPKALDRLPSKADVQRARIAADSVNGKLLISFGGNARSDGFGEMTSTPKKRHKFLTALDKLLEEYNLDGVDYNWEYPRSAEEWDSWGLLMRESKQLLLQHRRKKRINKSQNITNTNTDTNANETLSSTSSGDETVKSVTRSSVPVVTFTMYLDANHYKVIQHFDLLTTADYVHCMAYDSRGKHSTIDFAKQGKVLYFLCTVFLNSLFE